MERRRKWMERSGQTPPVPLTDLPAHLKTSGYHGVDGMSGFPFALTVLHGQITALDEQGVA